jgi:hypothetical protein
MEPVRKLAYAAAGLAVLVALVAPWTFVQPQPLVCLFSCPASPVRTEDGYASGGFAVALLTLGGLGVLRYAPAGRARAVAVFLLLGLAELLAILHPTLGVFEATGPAAWGSQVVAALLALVLLLLARDAWTERRGAVATGA